MTNLPSPCHFQSFCSKCVIITCRCWKLTPSIPPTRNCFSSSGSFSFSSRKWHRWHTISTSPTSARRTRLLIPFFRSSSGFPKNTNCKAEEPAMHVLARHVFVPAIPNVSYMGWHQHLKMLAVDSVNSTHVQLLQLLRLLLRISLSQEDSLDNCPRIWSIRSSHQAFLGEKLPLHTETFAKGNPFSISLSIFVPRTVDTAVAQLSSRVKHHVLRDLNISPFRELYISQNFISLHSLLLLLVGRLQIHADAFTVSLQLFCAVVSVLRKLTIDKQFFQRLSSGSLFPGNGAALD